LVLAGRAAKAKKVWENCNHGQRARPNDNTQKEKARKMAGVETVLKETW